MKKILKQEYKRKRERCIERLRAKVRNRGRGSEEEGERGRERREGRER